MMAERDTTDRYLASYLSDRVGAEFTGRVSGIAKFGLFIKLDETGADGLVPMHAVGHEYFHFDRDTATLMGADTGTIISLGQLVTVRLTEAVPVTGGIGLELLTLDGKELPKGRGGRSGRSGPGRGSPKRKASQSKRKSAKTSVKRRRVQRK